MANTLYTTGMTHAVANGVDTLDIRFLLIDNANPYTPNKDHATIADVVAGVVTELATTNYARQAAASEAVTADLTGDQVNLEFGDISWADLGPGTGGPTVQGALAYIHIDGTDANDIPLEWIDEAPTGAGNKLPFVVNGATFNLNEPTGGFIGIVQA